MPDFAIREEEPSDHARVDEIQEAAFGRPLEAEWVRALRGSDAPRLSLVAELREELVGHIFFSPVSIEGSVDSPPAGGLAPLAVAPAMQRQGAGSALVRAGLEACVPLGWRAVFLLGNPAYYSRFGFVLAAPLGLRYQSESFFFSLRCTSLRCWLRCTFRIHAIAANAPSRGALRLLHRAQTPRFDFVHETPDGILVHDKWAGVDTRDGLPDVIVEIRECVHGE